MFMVIIRIFDEEKSKAEADEKAQAEEEREQWKKEEECERCQATKEVVTGTVCLQNPMLY